jgi:hypothetical protein
MRTSFAARAAAVGAALAWSLSAALASAAPAAPPPGDKDKAATPAEAARKALNAPVTIKIDHQPLNAAVDMLREKTKVNFVLDSMTIQNTFGWTVDQPPTPVDVDLKDVKLKSALRTILSPYTLSYAVIGDTVVVTTEDVAIARQMRQRVNVEFDKVEFGQALKQLGRDTGANLLIDGRVEKEAKNAVSLDLEDVPLETAVRLLSEMAGLKPVRIGNVLFITDKKNAAELRQDPDLGGTPGHRQKLTGGVQRMRTFAARWWAVAAVAVVASTAAAAPAPPEREPAADPVAKARQALDRVVSLKLDRQPLDAALDQLGKKAGVNLAFDRAALPQPEVDSLAMVRGGRFASIDMSGAASPVVSVDLKDVTVRDALRNILDPTGLRYVVIGDQIVVSTEAGAMARQLRQRVHVDLDDVELSAALKRLGKETATNLVLDPRLAREAKTKVSLDLEDVTLETAVRLLAEAAGLKPVRVGGVLFVTSKKVAAELRADPDLYPLPIPPDPLSNVNW